MTDKISLYENLTVKNLEKSEVEAEAIIPWNVLLKEWPKALKKLNESASISGFRSGHIPEKVLVECVGELHVIEESANMLFGEIVFQIFSEKIPNAIGRPEISITKIAKGEPLHFKIKTAVVPDVTLPDYKSIAEKESQKKEVAIVVEDKEIEQVLSEMKSAIAHQDKKDVKDVVVDDEFAKRVGAFKDLTDLKEKIKENITMEKTTREKEKRRLAILDAILLKTSFDLPQILIESEQERMLSRFTEDIARMGLKADDYLAHIKKTREDLKKEMLPQAEKNAKFDFLLAAIAKAEKISPDTNAVDQETKHILSHHKDAKESDVRSYVTMILSHQKVFELLEGSK